jgi:Domain of unknown function (DUF5916)
LQLKKIKLTVLKRSFEILRLRDFTILFFLLLAFEPVNSQSAANDALYTTGIKKIDKPIKIDGILDDEGWQNLPSLGPFKEQFPFDSSLAIGKTEVRLAYDEDFIYISGVCYQSKYVVNSLRRDFPWGNSDIFIFLVDPFRDKLNGFYFSVTPYGVQKEALLSNGTDRNAEWDQVWFSEAKRYSDRYEVEMAIPFKTLRYKLNPDSPNTWNVNFARNNLQLNERSSWAPVPRNQMITDLAFCGKLQWENKPPKPGSNIVLIPYGLAGATRNYIDKTPTDTRITGGIDAKIGVTPSLNLDLTVNPDFAQVEVDRQVTNLSRFEIFFPERRQFFLENADIFSSSGFGNVSPFFSRRIGIGENVNNGENVQIPILFGARLSGRINQDWRMGVLNMTTAKSDKFGVDATNFTVASMQRRIGKRNFISGILVNKQLLNTDLQNEKFNRVAGMDFNFVSPGTRWQGKVFYHQGFTPEKKTAQNAMGANVEYNTIKWNFEAQVTNVGANYDPQVGFSPRTDYIRHSAQFNRVHFPFGDVSRVINNFYIGPDYDIVYGKGDGKILDWDAGLFFGINFQNSAQIRGAFLRWDYTYLFEPFDPTNTGGVELPANTSYLYFSNRLSFVSNQRRKFFYAINSRFGEYFNGNILQLQTTANLRIQPYAILSLDVNYTKIRLPQPYSSSELWLIGPRVDVTFTRKLFLTTFFQYNTQVNNININGRLQWRFRPVSDVFLVFTDNYYAMADFDDNGIPVNAWQPKERAIVLKFNYWLNL